MTRQGHNRVRMGGKCDNWGVSGSNESWVAQRTEAAAIQAARLAQRQDVEFRKAEAKLAEFLPVVTAHGPAPVDLIVQGYGGRGVARSNKRGWYLRNNKTVALGTDGKFYVLIAPLSTWDKLRGVKLSPTRPPLIIGEGGKDGESIDLSDAIERAMPGWRKFL